MADRKISELSNILGNDLANDDEFVVVDTSADETKAITYAELILGLREENTALGNDNLGLGLDALDSLPDSALAGERNTGIGGNSLTALTEGDDNTALGYNSGAAILTGSNNTLIGKDAGSLITTGAANTIIGQFDGNQGTLETLDLRTSDNHIVLSDGAGEPRIVVDDNGKVLIGNTSSVRVGGGAHNFQVANTTSVQLSLMRYGNAVGGSILTLGHTRSSTLGTVGTALVDADTVGQIDFAGDDGTDVNTVGARIRALVKGTVSSNNVPTDIVFSTFK